MEILLRHRQPQLADEPEVGTPSNEVARLRAELRLSQRTMALAADTIYRLIQYGADKTLLERLKKTQGQLRQAMAIIAQLRGTGAGPGSNSPPTPGPVSRPAADQVIEMETVSSSPDPEPQDDSPIRPPTEEEVSRAWYGSDEGSDFGDLDSELGLSE